jgi:hypothetical protein
MRSIIQNDYKKKTSKSKIEINDEIDFIFKVRTKFIDKRNNDAARTI